MPPKNNDPDFTHHLTPETIKRLGDQLKKMQEKKEPTIAELAAEGAKILEKEAKTSVKQKSKDLPQPKKPQSDLTQNPYLQARTKVLNNYKDWRKREIEEMESKGNVNNSHYAQFLIDVLQAAGDIPSDTLWNAARGMS